MNGDLPAVLALLHTSHQRWQTLEAAGEEWSDPEGSSQAFARLRRPGGVITMRGAPSPDRPGSGGMAERDRRWQLWMRRPDQARVEFGGGHQTRLVQVADGVQRWMTLPDGQVVADEGPRRPLRLGPAGPLVETAEMPAGLDLEVTGTTEVLGRPAFTVRGRTRDPEGGRGRGAFHPLLHVADELRFEVDAERGVILRLEAVMDGAVYYRLAMTRVAFDTELPPDLFAPPAPTSVRSRMSHAGPSPSVLGADAGIHTVLVRTPSLVVALDHVVAYPDGFEVSVTVRVRDEPTHGTVEPAHPRTWGGRSAFPGESLRFGVVFADGRSASVGNFRKREPVAANAGVTLLPLNGVGTQGRFDQRYWVQPLPPSGPLGLVVAWPARDLAETRVDVPADAILEAAARATVLWDQD